MTQLQERPTQDVQFQEKLWRQFMKAITDTVSLTGSEALQVVYPFTPWDWGGKDWVEGTYPYEQWAALDVVPALPLQNAKESPASAQSGFSTGFKNWYTKLAIGDTQGDEHYQRLQAELKTLEGKYNRALNTGKAAWINSGSTATFAVWLSTDDGYSYNAAIKEARKELENQQDTIDEYLDRLQTPVKDIKKRYNDPSYKVTVWNPITNKDVVLRTWATNPLAAIQHVNTITDTNYGHDATKGNKATIKFDYSSTKYDSDAYEFGGKVTWQDFGYAVDVQGNYQSIKWNEVSENYSVEVTYQDLTTVTVSPDGWYAGTDITTYGRGPYATGYSAFKDGDKNYFFGPGGALSRLYTGLIVGYRPTIKLDLGEAVSNFLYTHWEANATVRIGPFAFNANGENENESSTMTKKGSGLEIQSNANWPMINAMKSDWTLNPKS
ncbi:hypothetical protein ACQPYE_11380 [Actinosynnema sp. CA-299493]